VAAVLFMKLGRSGAAVVQRGLARLHESYQSSPHRATGACTGFAGQPQPITWDGFPHPSRQSRPSPWTDGFGDPSYESSRVQRDERTDWEIHPTKMRMPRNVGWISNPSREPRASPRTDGCGDPSYESSRVQRDQRTDWEIHPTKMRMPPDARGGRATTKAVGMQVARRRGAAPSVNAASQSLRSSFLIRPCLPATII
jgi:hypothetical protein